MTQRQSQVLCYPVGLWTLYALYGKNKFPKMDMLWLFLGALFYHVVLMAGIVGVTKAGISEWTQGLIMIFDATCVFYFWWLVGRKQHLAA